MLYILHDIDDILTELVHIINALDNNSEISRDFARCRVNIMFCLEYQCAHITDVAAKLNVRDCVNAHVSAASCSLPKSSESSKKCCVIFIQDELYRAVEVLMNWII